MTVLAACKFILLVLTCLDDFTLTVTVTMVIIMMIIILVAKEKQFWFQIKMI